KDYSGADSMLRYGATSDGGHDEIAAAQTLGRSWFTGNVVGTFQYQSESPLRAATRSSTDELPVPNELFPRSKDYSLAVDGRQQIASDLDFYGDVLAAKRDFDSIRSSLEPGLGNFITRQTGTSRSLDLNPGLRYSFSPQWSVELKGMYGSQQ